MSSSIQDISKPTAASGAVNLVANGIFAYFFYTYAFMNPDTGTCYAKDGNKTGFDTIPVTTTGTGEDALDTPQEGFVNVSEQF